MARKDIMNALLAVLQKAGTFKTSGRRLVDPEGIAKDESPALFLVAHEDLYEREKGGYDQRPKREIKAWALIYNDVGTDANAIPEDFIDDALDAIDTLLAPDNRAFNTQTLGGLVQACLIDGTVLRSSGDVSGKAQAAVPIRILLP